MLGIKIRYMEAMLDYVIRHLDDTKGRWEQVAADSGVPFKTLNKIAYRVTADPRVSTVQKLHDYFQNEDASA